MDFISWLSLAFFTNIIVITNATIALLSINMFSYLHRNKALQGWLRLVLAYECDFCFSYNVVFSTPSQII